MQLNINDDKYIESPSISEIQDSISELEMEEFVILNKSEDHYLQTYCNDLNDYVLEYRDGSFEKHFGVMEKELSKTKIAEVFTLYLCNDKNWKEKYSWERIEFDEDFEGDLNSENAYLLNGSEYKRIRIGSEKLNIKTNGKCRTCGESNEAFHLSGCASEECPRCHFDLVTCDCE